MNPPFHNQPKGRRDYASEDVEAARIALGELADLLHDHGEAVVLVGGSVPFFSIDQEISAHIGTKDIDIAIDPTKISNDTDETLNDILMKALYQQDPKFAFRWYKGIEVNGTTKKVILDLLTGERSGKTDSQLQKIDDVFVSTIAGCDIAFVSPKVKRWQTTLPDGTSTFVQFQVACGPAFITMKGLALHNRDKIPTIEHAQKDAYDIYYMIKFYPGGHEALTLEFSRFTENPYVADSLLKIANKWTNVNANGPQYVASREDDEVAREILAQDAYQQVSELLRLLGVAHDH